MVWGTVTNTWARLRSSKKFDGAARSNAKRGRPGIPAGSTPTHVENVRQRKAKCKFLNLQI